MRVPADPETDLSLLKKLKVRPTDDVAWHEFVARYGEKILGWCRSWGLQDADAADVTQADGRSAILEACPQPDIMVTNPGVRQVPGDFRTMPREDWDGWFEAHFYSSLELIRQAAHLVLQSPHHLGRRAERRGHDEHGNLWRWIREWRCFANSLFFGRRPGRCPHWR